MKKLIYTLTLFITFTLLANNNTNAQSVTYTSYQLPAPQYLSPLFVGSLNESAIYYGQEHWYNKNKPVIVFVHGFIDLANLWFSPGNDIYYEANKRYRTAFVATTRGEGMWRNGEILATMLEDIVKHYKTNKVIIVAHSNGGKASEVAMFHYDKYQLVDRVITLGTPFKGTGLADIAELPGMEYIVDLVGLGGGTSTSTTYYMEGHARPILDNDPDNQPNKFINFGAWGYDNGTTVAAPAMYAGGLILNTMGGGDSNGGNDGVTPYYSSTRPGGSQMWGGWCWSWWCNLNSRYDHIDITYDYIMWDEIKPYLTGSLPNRMMQQEEIDRASTLTSNFELITTMDGAANQFRVPADAGEVTVNVIHPDVSNQFNLIDDSGNDLTMDLMVSKGLNESNYSHQTLYLEKGTYQINSDAVEYAAIVSYENGAQLTFDNSQLSYEEGETITFNASILNTKQEATITAVLYAKSDINGKSIQTQSYVVQFELNEEGKYVAILENGVKAGIYNLQINAEGETFRRTIISGIVVKNKENSLLNIEESSLNISTFPNPTTDYINVSIELENEGTNAAIHIYDAYGRTVQSQNLAKYSEGTHTIQFDMNTMPKGTYFISFENENKIKTEAVIKL